MSHSKPLWTQPFPRWVVFKWMLMAFAAGNINAGGFMACKRFVTHVTGFATWFGMAAAAGDWTAAAGMLSVPFYFLLGVMIGGFFTDAAIVKGRSPRFGLVMGLVAALLLVATLGGYFKLFGRFGVGFVLAEDYPLIVLLCAASGLLNAVITTSSGGLVRSTHMTGTTTDLGVGIMRALFGHKRQGPMRQRELYRNWLRAGTIAAFVLGSVVGAVLFTLVQYLGFLLPCVLAVYVGNLGVRAVALPEAAAGEPLLPEPARSQRDAASTPKAL